MPELPEVEVTRRGIAPTLLGRRVSAVRQRVPALRYPLPEGLEAMLAHRVLTDIRRRAKYLLFRFDSSHGECVHLLLHLGMSGTLRLLPAGLAPGKHDHVDLEFGDIVLRLNDPRRFGALLLIEGEPASHPLLASLGVEPLEHDFTAEALRHRLSGRTAAIKLAIMDNHIVVGVGNIYASESLFRAGIDPRKAAGSVALLRLRRLVPAIRETLQAAIAAGGSTLRDFFGCDGDPGHFQLEHRVYDRAGEPCRNCGAAIRLIRQGQRSTYFCPRCQR